LTIGIDDHHYIFTKYFPVNENSDLTSAFLIALAIGFVAELGKFLRWFITVRRRITKNSLQLILNTVSPSGYNPLS